MWALLLSKHFVRKQACFGGNKACHLKNKRDLLALRLHVGNEPQLSQHQTQLNICKKNNRVIKNTRQMNIHKKARAWLSDCPHRQKQVMLIWWDFVLKFVSRYNQHRFWSYAPCFTGHVFVRHCNALETFYCKRWIHLHLFLPIYIRQRN